MSGYVWLNQVMRGYVSFCQVSWGFW